MREEFVFVTNNARDFRHLMGQLELHAGLIVIIPNVTPTVQVASWFERALSEVTRPPDLINKVIEVDVHEIRAYELPTMK